MHHHRRFAVERDIVGMRRPPPALGIRPAVAMEPVVAGAPAVHAAELAGWVGVADLEAGLRDPQLGRVEELPGRDILRTVWWASTPRRARRGRVHRVPSSRCPEPREPETRMPPPTRSSRSAGPRLHHRRPSRGWVIDFTYCRSWAGFCYVAFIVDVFAQKIVAWHAATTKTTELVMTPLRMALWQRGREGYPRPSPGS